MKNLLARSYYLLLIATSLSSCTTTPVIVTPGGDVPAPVPSPIAQRDWPVKGWQPEYTQFIKDKTPEFLLADEPAGYEPTSWCPKYHSLSREQRKQFWADFWFNLVKPESNYDRTLQYVETTMSIDAVTGLQVKSEGLTQLSYQDRNSYRSCPTCQKFDWSSDKGKALKDRTIMDPFNNLGCAIEIMEWTLKRYPGVPFRQAGGKYWLALREGLVSVPAVCK